MNIEINEAYKMSLEQYKDKLLMDGSRLYVIKTFATEKRKVKRKKIFGGEETEEKLVLTKLNIMAYSTEGRFLGYLADSAVFKFLHVSNLYTMRQNWDDFKGMLQAFGYKIVPVVKPETKEICNCDKRDMPVQEDENGKYCPQCGHTVL